MIPLAFITLFLTFAWCGFMLFITGGKADLPGYPVVTPLVCGLSLAALFAFIHWW